MLINGHNIETPKHYDDRDLIYRGGLTWQLFGKKIPVMTTRGVSPDYAKKCARALNGLSENAVNSFFSGVKKYCLWYEKNMYRDINSFMSVQINENTPPRDIMADISPRRLVIAAPEGRGVGFCVSFDCDWENWDGLKTRYGLCAAVLDGGVVFVGTDMIFSPEDKHLDTFMNWADGFENYD